MSILLVLLVALATVFTVNADDSVCGKKAYCELVAKMCVITL